VTSKHIRTVKFNALGGADVLQIEAEEQPTPRAGELRLKVGALGLNRAEVLFRQGLYLEEPKLPSRLGYEASGIVDAIGDGVTGFEIGDKVSTVPAFSMGEYGVYSDSIVVPAMAVAHYPVQLSPSEGAALWMQYITAYGALVDIASLGKGQTVLITAASSSVGIAAIQIAKYLGATVIATTRSPEKSRVLTCVGADFVIETNNQDLVESVTGAVGDDGVELVFDAIGGPIVAELAAVVSQGGRIIEYGVLDERPTPFPLFAALAKGIIIQGYTLFEITKDSKRLEAAKSFIYNMLSNSGVRPLLDKQFDFDEIQVAHEYMESNQQVGKITVTI